MYYIYEYVDPRTQLPFYIGKGKGERKYDHMNSSLSRNENKEKCKIINELHSLGLSPVINEIESNIENELIAYNREDFYILKYGRRGIDPHGILTNQSLHGRPPKPIWTDEKKKKHSEFNKLYWTAERRKTHGKEFNKNSIKGGKASIGTVSVVDSFGNTQRIPRAQYQLIDKTQPINLQEYVSCASLEGKKRMKRDY